jgi:hypothetical protein
MQIDQNNFIPLTTKSYVSFDAISLRNLIIERMNAQGVFTDQNYIGSNLASIIDIISYAFNTLLFYLNRTSSESVFTEAQLYENINRIVKLLDYNPIGYQTSTLAFQLSANNSNSIFKTSGEYYTIPRYSYITIGGKQFSFNEDISFAISKPNGVVNLSEISNRKLLFQGVFRESPEHIASGNKNELIVLNVINAVIDHFNIHVYVYETQQNKWIQYKETTSLYIEQPDAKVYEKRLNSNLQYEIIFGDDVNGRRLKANEKVRIYFLQSSGEEGIIGPRELNDKNLSYTIYNTETFNDILKFVKQDISSLYITKSQFQQLKFSNASGSTLPKDIESADEIRKHAPASFNSQYRLVTQTDYETYIKTNFANFINDAKVFNNWEYTSIYLKYLRSLNVDPINFQQTALNQVLYADSCNFNNLYLCAVPRAGYQTTLKYLLPAQKEAIVSGVEPLKTVTSELVFLDPVYKGVCFGLEDENSNVNIDDRTLCRLELIKTQNTKKSDQSLILETAKVFQDFFNPAAQKLGQMFDYSKLVSNILSIDGIEKIFTTRIDRTFKFDGLRLFLWNPTFSTIDKRAISNNITTHPFDFIYFDDLVNISRYITVGLDNI